MEQTRFISLFNFVLIVHFSNVGFSQTVLDGELTFYEICYRDSAGSKFNFYYCSDGADYYPCDFLAFENRNALYDSNTKVYVDSNHLVNQVREDVREAAKFLIYTRPAVYEIRFEISLKMVTYKCQYEVATFSKYIPVPFERKLNIGYNLTPISLKEKINRPDEEFIKYLVRYYYDLLGFLQSEYMFYYDLR
jgi:hypothetical protein